MPNKSLFSKSVVGVYHSEVEKLKQRAICILIRKPLRSDHTLHCLGPETLTYQRRLFCCSKIFVSSLLSSEPNHKPVRSPSAHSKVSFLSK
ncbi:hypothetical protein EG68_01959 [Paragonimus skrjabini miyazakii]|uniref:Uncharacterized protein n=1 Tax=Paragonimus skrjabini miyazakii TaxID=59628 RepID=A0A8S9Z0W9_9TREM|nr:hypothetical protein EG68_01959 [Paragonimus skrjabini miyazakii]